MQLAVRGNDFPLLKQILCELSVRLDNGLRLLVLWERLDVLADFLHNFSSYGRRSRGRHGRWNGNRSHSTRHSPRHNLGLLSSCHRRSGLLNFTGSRRGGSGLGVAFDGRRFEAV